MVDPEAPQRRFLLQPVEVTSRSQRKQHREVMESTGNHMGVDTSMDMGDASPAKEGTGPGSGTTPFRIEPVEVTVKSDRQASIATNFKDDAALKPDQPLSRFSPLAVEARREGNRQKMDEGAPEISTGSTRRFKPEPVETSTRRNRRNAPQDSTGTNPQHPYTPDMPPASDEEKTNPPPRKKFVPQLIETTKRSRKKDDTAPCVKATDKTEFTPGDPEYTPRKEKRPGRMPIAPENTPVGSADGIHRLPYERRLAAANARGNIRQHSWMVPALESIESSGSDPEDEKVPSLSTSPSASSTETADLQRISSRRETCDDRFSGYLLSLAAKAAEKQMRDQAMAAFPNDDYHEPVDHFAVDRENTGDTDREDDGLRLPSRERHGDADMNRRDSPFDWQLDEMQKHQATLADQRKRTELEEEIAKRPSQAVPTIGAPFQSRPAIAFDASGQPNNMIGGRQRDVGLEQMRHAASPPMLGNDLLFRKCQSPQETKLDVDQYPYSGAGSERRRDGGGLWMGFCAATTNGSAPSHQILSGLMTPGPESTNAVDRTDGQLPKSNLPPTPESIEERLKIRGVEETFSLETALEKEFSDDFVTQVFNYLSLGYPSMARKFDEELSKISGMSTQELCKDDKHVNTKGYVGLEEGRGQEQGGACEIRRWKALKLYIFEWGKQHPGMSAGHFGPDAWGVRARRGSWAI